MKQKTYPPEPTSQPPRSAVVRAPGAGETYAMASGPQIARIGSADTSGAYELIEVEAVPDSGPPLHVHRNFDEAFFVLEGDLTLRVGAEEHVLPPRAVAVVPAGAVHAWKNASSSTIRFLQLTVPGGMEPFTAELAAAPKPLTIEAMARIGDRHGTTIVGPPI